MPGSLDSCINNVYEDGNIPASSGMPPVRVILRDAIAVTITETAAADAVLDWVPPGGVARSAMIDGAFINSDGTPRAANAGGVMVNL